MPAYVHPAMANRFMTIFADELMKNSDWRYLGFSVFEGTFELSCRQNQQSIKTRKFTNIFLLNYRGRELKGQGPSCMPAKSWKS